jgi:hypothetical protein
MRKVASTGPTNTTKNPPFIAVRGLNLTPRRPFDARRGALAPNKILLIAVVQYENGVMMIRFFGSHEEYDQELVRRAGRFRSVDAYQCLCTSGQ